MSRAETRDSTPSHLQRIPEGEVHLKRVATRFSGLNTPAFTGNVGAATLTCRQTSLPGDIYVNDNALECRGADIARHISTRRDTSQLQTNMELDKENKIWTCNEKEATFAFDNSNAPNEILSALDSIVVLSNTGASGDEFNTSREGTRRNRSFKMRRNKCNITPRRGSLPSCFLQLSVHSLASMACNSAPPKAGNDRLPDSSAEACCIESDASNLAAVTPPPSYRSLIKQNLADIPPSYESVTGLSLNAGQVCFHQLLV